MRPSSRSLVLGILALAVLAVPCSALAADRPVRSSQPAVSALPWAELVGFLRSWLVGGLVKPGAWRSASPGYEGVWAKAGSSMDPNGSGSTTPVIPPRVPPTS
jgi:hypothetical protein